MIFIGEGNSRLSYGVCCQNIFLFDIQQIITFARNQSGGYNRTMLIFHLNHFYKAANNLSPGFAPLLHIHPTGISRQ